MRLGLLQCAQMYPFFSDPTFEQHDSIFYFNWFMRLTKLSYLLLQYVTAYLFLSIFISVCVVCLSVRSFFVFLSYAFFLQIYYAINAKELTSIAEIDRNTTTADKVHVYSEAGWALLQVFYIKFTKKKSICPSGDCRHMLCSMYYVRWHAPKRDGKLYKRVILSNLYL